MIAEANGWPSEDKLASPWLVDESTAEVPAGTPAETPAEMPGAGRGESGGEVGGGAPGRRHVLLGLASLVSERVRGHPSSSGEAVAVGLVQEGLARARTVAERLTRPFGAPRVVSWSLVRLERVTASARRTGERTLHAARGDAAALLERSARDASDWAQRQVVPQLVDGLVPHLVTDVVPRLIDGIMPEVRARVLPVIIDDLTHDARVRELVLDQSRGLAGEATEQLRGTAADADDRVEAAFHRLVPGRPADPSKPPDPSGAP